MHIVPRDLRHAGLVAAIAAALLASAAAGLAGILSP